MFRQILKRSRQGKGSRWNALGPPLIAFYASRSLRSRRTSFKGLCEASMQDRKTRTGRGARKSIRPVARRSEPTKNRWPKIKFFLPVPCAVSEGVLWLVPARWFKRNLDPPCCSMVQLQTSCGPRLRICFGGRYGVGDQCAVRCLNTSWRFSTAPAVDDCQLRCKTTTDSKTKTFGIKLWFRDTKTRSYTARSILI